jgi:hydrogenase-4 transcriptional activator
MVVNVSDKTDKAPQTPLATAATHSSNRAMYTEPLSLHTHENSETGRHGMSWTPTVDRGEPWYVVGDMDFDTRLWREASLAADVDGFLERAGAAVLDELAADAAVVRATDSDGRRIETLGAIRRGSVGVSLPARPRGELDEIAAARVMAWIRAGGTERAGARGGSQVARDLLRGVDDDGDGDWWLVPLSAHAEPLGVLMVAPAPRAASQRRLAAVAESLAAVLSKEHARRELSRLREAAEAEKSAALARLQMRDIGVSVVGADTGLREVMRQVEQVAPTAAPVLILGETGSGKEVVARAIHERSGRAQGPVLRVNCGAIAPELVDSELFGHERGSFTGATSQRSGWFERADGGTLFLDEIAELPLAAQVRLLRVLQDGVFERVGGTRALHVDVRIVAATHRDLRAMVSAGTFRDDLWYRINVFTIRLPPLRERPDDIAPLATHFADRVGRRFGSGPLAVTAADVALLRGYDWPGNVRELATVIERAAILGEGRRLDLPRALGVQGGAGAAAAPASSEFATLDDAIRQHIERALVRCQGRIEGGAGAAKLLGVNPNTLRSRMQRLGIDWDRFRQRA